LPKWRIFVRILRLMRLKSLVFVLLLFTTSRYVNASPPLEKDGTLVALITWGDVENTPAKAVYVEAHGYVDSIRAEKSFVFKMVRAGRYEASLPPGVYDVFVSDGSSEPRCRRMRVAPGDDSFWTLKLEFDEIYSQH
jgi:hypothetical protein